MNVDILGDNPRWSTYFYLAVPTFVLVILTVLVLKYLPLESFKNYLHKFNLRSYARIRFPVRDEESLEMPSDEEQNLYNASAGGSTRVMKQILDKHTKNLDKIDRNLKASGKNLLCVSSANGHAAAVRLLLDRGVTAIDETD